MATLITGANVWDGISAQAAPRQVLVVDGRIQRVADAIEALAVRRARELFGCRFATQQMHALAGWGISRLGARDDGSNAIGQGRMSIVGCRRTLFCLGNGRLHYVTPGSRHAEQAKAFKDRYARALPYRWA